MAEAVARLQLKPCPEKLRLMEEYQAATAEFSRTLKVLNQKIGVLSGQEYEKIRKFTEQARKRSEAARQALDRHIREHGC